MAKIVSIIVGVPIVAIAVLVGLGFVAMIIDGFALRADQRRSDAERCFHHADYGEPPCDHR